MDPATALSFVPMAPQALVAQASNLATVLGTAFGQRLAVILGHRLADAVADGSLHAIVVHQLRPLAVDFVDKARGSSAHAAALSLAGSAQERPRMAAAAMSLAALAPPVAMLAVNAAGFAAGTASFAPCACACAAATQSALCASHSVGVFSLLPAAAATGGGFSAKTLVVSTTAGALVGAGIGSRFSRYYRT